MSFIPWKAEYEIGNASIDKQHKTLVDLLNALHDAMTAGGKKDRVDAVYAGLVQYTELHFRNEESMLASAGYAGLSQHKQEHARFVAQLREHGEALKAGRFTAPMQLLTTVKNWLFQHILSSDKAYMKVVGTKHSAAAIEKPSFSFKR